jgi:hypothetical protein
MPSRAAYLIIQMCGLEMTRDDSGGFCSIPSLPRLDCRILQDTLSKFIPQDVYKCFRDAMPAHLHMAIQLANWA